MTIIIEQVAQAMGRSLQSAKDEDMSELHGHLATHYQCGGFKWRHQQIQHLRKLAKQKGLRSWRDLL